MDTIELNGRLIAIGEKIKQKGWASASIDIFVSYLAIFDREPEPLDPMISYCPSIRASTRDRYSTPTTHQFVRDTWDIKTLEQAVAKLEESANDMPRMTDEQDRLEKAKAKLSDEERRLLGVR
jgi:hypothetical protein